MSYIQTGRQAGIKTNCAKFKFFHIIENLKLWTLNLLSPVSQSRLFGFPDFHKTGKKLELLSLGNTLPSTPMSFYLNRV